MKPLLEQVALLILQAVILVLAFILLAISLLVSLINFIIISGILAIVGTGTLWGFTILNNGFSIHVQSNLNSSLFKYEIQVAWVRIEILKMYLPVLLNNYYLEDSLTHQDVENLLIASDETGECSIFDSDDEIIENSLTSNDQSERQWWLDFGRTPFSKTLDPGTLYLWVGIITLLNT
ncbi:MAG: hypothetical protein EAX96_21405, partial [Candidatus Lokiarchaeota archaeon]|nr:hypothetical protein [Candidatus Lokiarchaeota archaeon]